MRSTLRAVRDPLDIIGHWFMEIAACWIVLVAIPLLWVTANIVLGIRRKLAHRRSGAARDGDEAPSERDERPARPARDDSLGRKPTT